MHVDVNVVTEIIKQIESKFGKMTVTRGKVHDFLGMNLTFKEDGTVEVRMQEYTEEYLIEFGPDMNESAATPVKKDLFEIDEDSAVLNKKEGERFHSMVARLLFLSKRG